MVRELELREILEGAKKEFQRGDILSGYVAVEHALNLLNSWIAQEEKWAEEEYQKFLREEVRTC